MTFAPLDPHFAERVRASFSRQRVMAYLGALLTEVAPGYCEVRLPFRPELCQQHNYFHGGIIGTIGDSAGGYAAYTLMPTDASVLTVEYKLNLMAPADGDVLVARGSVLRPGRTLTVSRADIAVIKGHGERLCATLLQTLMTVRGKTDAVM